MVKDCDVVVEEDQYDEDSDELDVYWRQKKVTENVKNIITSITNVRDARANSSLVICVHVDQES